MFGEYSLLFLFGFVIFLKILAVDIFLYSINAALSHFQLPLVDIPKNACQFDPLCLGHPGIRLTDHVADLLIDHINMLLKLLTVFDVLLFLEVLYLLLHLAPEEGHTQRHIIFDPAHALPPEAQPLNVLEVKVLCGWL